MTDGIGRTIDYLRISVTDKCNLRCKYCMPPEGIDLMPHEELLSLEEIFRVVKIMAPMGISKVRFTGGEPLVRKNLVKLISDVNELPQIKEIAMTTNGVLFAGMADDLKKAGLNSVNISLDTLNSRCFENITGADAGENVVSAVFKALECGIKTKINCVPCREFNEDDISELVSLAQNNNIDVRFIELMPIGCGKNFHGIPSDEILQKLEEKYGKYIPSEVSFGNGPAKYYEFDNFKGRVGFISPISHQFCSECNRVRLTAEGRLKLCLHFDKGIELKPLLRGGFTDEEIREEIKKAVLAKPKAHEFGNSMPENISDTRKMVQIGG